ncbi:MAG: rod shape-determining protein MreD [Clostridia bacterium]|nr:rod shape-determining protein MreD [Clostridia bacterium]
MRHVWKILVLILAFVLDSTLGSFISIFDIAPSFLFASVMIMAMTGGFGEAGIYGAVAGILWDLAWGRTFGFYTLLYMYSALSAHGFLELVYKSSPLLTACITCVATFLCELIVYLLAFTIWGEGFLIFNVFRYMLPTAIYTAAVQLCIFRPVNALSRPGQERGMRL